MGKIAADMIKQFRQLLSTVAVLTVLKAAKAQDCSSKTVNECLLVFNNTRVFSNPNAPIDADLPNWNETLPQLQDRCRAYTLFSQCMVSVIPVCNQSYQDYFKGLNEGYAFLCSTNEELQKMVAYQKCYVREKVRQDEIYCNTTYMDKIDSLKYTSPGQDRVTKFCSYTDTYLSCLTTSVQSLCDADAADWQEQWNIKRRRQQMQVTFNCPGWTPAKDTAIAWTIGLSVVLGLTTIIMVIGILIILVFIKRKKKSHRRAAVPPPPPPYTSDPFGPYDEPAPVVSADLSEPSISLPGRSSYLGVGTSGEQAVAVNMRPTNKCPVKPPPYADQNAPAYESVSGASPPNNQGQVNQGYQNREEVKEEEEEDIHPKPAESGAAATGNVTESERELNTNWF